MKNIDLHMHSFYSDDGEFTVEELVKMNHDANVKYMAIADHNWVKAVEKGIKECQKYDMTLIPAIEIDCTYQGINLHVLGYGINYHNPVFNDLGENIERQEKEASLKKIELVRQLGFDISKEDLDKVSNNSVYTGEMFAEILLNDERYINYELLKPYRENGLRSDNPYVNFYWDYFSQGKPCFVDIKFPSLEEIIQLIHDNNGIAILAHPGNNLKNRYEVFDDMVKLGLDGVEAYSSYHTKESIDYFKRKALQYKIIYTCGSDFHGKTKPSISLLDHHLDDTDEVYYYLREKHLI